VSNTKPPVKQKPKPAPAGPDPRGDLMNAIKAKPQLKSAVSQVQGLGFRV